MYSDRNYKCLEGVRNSKWNIVRETLVTKFKEIITEKETKKRGECQVRNCSWGNSDSQELHAMTQLTGC